MSNLIASDEQVKVVVHRHWHQPALEVQGQRLSILMADFLEAVAYEMGAPAVMLTHREMTARLKQASASVLSHLEKDPAACGPVPVRAVSAG